MTEEHKLSMLEYGLRSGFANEPALKAAGLGPYVIQFKALYDALKNPSRAYAIFAYMIAISDGREEALGWLKQEMDFEIAVATGADRKALAAEKLAKSDIDDYTLDLHNQRIFRDG